MLFTLLRNKIKNKIIYQLWKYQDSIGTKNMYTYTEHSSPEGNVGKKKGSGEFFFKNYYFGHHWSWK